MPMMPMGSAMVGDEWCGVDIPLAEDVDGLIVVLRGRSLPSSAVRSSQPCYATRWTAQY